MIPEFGTLRVEVEGSLGRITLERPGKLNALAPDPPGPDRRGPLVRRAGSGARGHRLGEGRSFSAGFDLDDFANPSANFGVRETADLGRIMAETVTAMPQITIAAIQGHCVGGGLVLAASCDLRVAAQNAVFSIPEVDLGIPLAWGGIPRLVREIGPAATKELVITCRRFFPEEAKALGFLNTIVPAEDSSPMWRTLPSRSPRSPGTRCAPPSSRSTR